MRTALDVHQELLALDVRHEIVRLRDRVSSADELPKVLDLTDGCAAVRCWVVSTAGPAHAPDVLLAVLVRAGSEPCGEAVLAAARATGVATGTQARVALPAEVNAATEFAAGLVSPVGLPAGVPLLVDAVLAARHVLYTAVGEGGVALGIRTRDLLAVTGAHVVPLARAGEPTSERRSGLE